MNPRRLHLASAVTGAALAIAALWPILFRAGLPAYQHDWSWPFDAHVVLTGALNHLSTWNPAGLGSPNALASNNPLHLIIALPAFIVSGAAAGKIVLGVCAAVAALSIYVTSVRTMQAGPLAAVAAAVLYTTLPLFINKIGAGHIAYWIAYALFALLFERGVRYAQVPGARVFAHIALLAAACTIQPQFAAFGVVAAFAGALRGGWRTAAGAAAAAITGAVLVLFPTLYSLSASQSYLNALYIPPRLSWENGMSTALPQALWMTEYVVPYFQMSSWPVDWLLIAEIVFALACAVFARRENKIAIAVLAIAALFFTTGTLGPFAVFWRNAFLHWPAATLFRETYNANALLVLAYALGAACASRVRFLPVAALALALVQALPLFGGGIARAVPNVTLAHHGDEQQMLSAFPAGRVAATPFAEPMLLDARGPGGLDMGAPSDGQHQSLSEYPTIFPLTTFSLSRCYCEAWFLQAMRHANVTGLIVRPNLASADLVRQRAFPVSPRHVRARALADSEGLVSFARQTIAQPLSFDTSYDAAIAALADPIGPLPGNASPAAVVLPAPDRRSDDVTNAWVSLARWFGRAADPHAAIESGVTTLSKAPLTLRLPEGTWYLLYASQRPLRIQAAHGTIVEPAAVHARWTPVPGGTLSISAEGGAATIYRAAHGKVALPLGRYTMPAIAKTSRRWPWRIDVRLSSPAQEPSVLVFRERYSPQWTVQGARTLWHGVADGYANAFLVEDAARDVRLVYAPQGRFFLLSIISWVLLGILAALALPIRSSHASRT